MEKGDGGGRRVVRRPSRTKSDRNGSKGWVVKGGRKCVELG